MDCGNDIKLLKNKAGENSEKIPSRNFLSKIIGRNTGFTPDTELGNIRVGLTLEECKNIVKKLNI